MDTVRRENLGLREGYGQLGSMMTIALLVIGILLAAYAVDFSHASMVQSELHNATDAAALAGAQELWFNINEADTRAREIAALNKVDGKVLSTSTPGTTLDIVVTPPKGNAPGTVRCSATVQVFHLFAPFFGRRMDAISSTSLAGTEGKVWILGEGQAFPIAVSLDAVPQLKNGSGVALNTLNLGDTFILYLGAQNPKNATFTSLTKSPASASYIGNAIDQLLGLSEPIPGYVPSVKLGSQINLNNGIDGQKKLANNPYFERLQGKTIVLPVIMGSPPFNQSSPVVAFIGLKVTTVNTAKSEKENASGKKDEGNIVESISGTLVRPQVVGVSGPIPTTGIPINDLAIDRLELGPIQLIE